MASSQRTNRVNAGVRYEKRDVRFKPLIVSIMGLLALLVVIAGATAGVFHFLAARTNRTPSHSIVVQHDSAHELHEHRQRESQLLNSYEWVSREDGIVRIPIERAIELALEDTEPEQ